jgi:CBS-domain-containing membrane protein
MISRAYRLCLGIVSAPLWSSETQAFAGMLTVSDFISLIQYYYHHPSEQHEIETIQISKLYNNTKLHQDNTPITLQQNYPIHPMTSLYDVALLMSKSRAHRIPLVIENKEIISIITQYRLMKFVANNVSSILYYIKCFNTDKLV